MATSGIRSILAAVPFAFAAACAASTPSYRVDTSVRALKSGARDATGLSAVDGATVALQCPDSAQSRELGMTTQGGTLHAEGDGTFPLDCKVNVSKEGFRASSFSVSEICGSVLDGGCRELHLAAVLQPARGGSAGGQN
jgi:hypothetical protein